MKRMTLSMICILTFIAIALSASLATARDDRRGNVTVSFGQWDPNNPRLREGEPGEDPLDRLLEDPAQGRGNNHAVLPGVVKIKAGEAVNFIISGGHVVTVYDDGTQPEDIDTSVTESAANCPTTAGGIINDPVDRIYRGPCFAPAADNDTSDPRRDGVEVVLFKNPGTYLVICARKNHFVNDGMFGFVRVKKAKKGRR